MRLGWGRISRQAYWIGIAVIVGLLVFLPFVAADAMAVTRPISLAWIVLWIPRLHDIGKSAWYALIPFAIETAIVIVGFTLWGDTLMQIFSPDNTALDESDPRVLYASLVIMAAVAVQIGFTIWLGSVRGDTASNRFGDAPQW